ncbi:MAG: KilA-N domain-containing protein [Tannerella sp.]|nr:KilA-N domain-containing protein [Tannerella sp.]
MTPENAIGIVSKAGRYGGGTFAHRNIAFEFASRLSPECKYCLIREFERLKRDEQQQQSLE